MLTLDYIFSEFRQGRLEAFYKDTYGKLLVYASKRLGADYAFLAEDCVQDAVYKAYCQRDSFADVASFHSFFYSCIRNAAIDILRKNRAQQNYLSQQDSDTEFFSSVVEQETLNYLYDAIEDLPLKYKKIFELHFQEGLKNAEIADLLGVTESAVKKQKARLLTLLREDLRKKTGDDLLFSFLLLNGLSGLVLG